MLRPIAAKFLFIILVNLKSSQIYQKKQKKFMLRPIAAFWIHSKI